MQRNQRAQVNPLAGGAPVRLLLLCASSVPSCLRVSLSPCAQATKDARKRQKTRGFLIVLDLRVRAWWRPRGIGFRDCARQTRVAAGLRHGGIGGAWFARGAGCLFCGSCFSPGDAVGFAYLGEATEAVSKLDVTSGTCGNGAGIYLSFSISPVQDYVEAARTVRDLWTGSYMLSWLTATAAARVMDAGGAVFSPAMDGMRSEERRVGK